MEGVEKTERFLYGDKHHGRVKYRYITERGGGEDRYLVNFMTEDKKSKKF